MASRVQIKVVELLKDLQHGERLLKPGTRLPAWKSNDGWRVLFNGAEIPASADTAGEIESPAVQAAVEKRSAREEEYQSSPSPTWNNPNEPAAPPEPLQ